MNEQETQFEVSDGAAQVVASRVFAAPRQLVFAAYTEARHLRHWWGPRELTTEVERLELRLGGIWRFLQRDREGHVHAFHGVFHEVLSPELLVRTFEYEGAPHHVLLSSTRFAELEGGGTRITEQSIFQSPADRDQMVGTGMERGVRESMERLAELLAER